MPSVIILDSGPLGIITNPKKTPANEDCREWLKSMLDSNVRVLVPEIADYEVRRELLRGNKQNGLKRLDALLDSSVYVYLPLTTSIMRRAAQLWAQARQQGKQTAPDLALDGDMILIAQALSLNLPAGEVIIATMNVSDIARFFPADIWENIQR